MLTKKCAVLRIVHGNARSKPHKHHHKKFHSGAHRRSSAHSFAYFFQDIYFVLTIQRGAIPWLKGEFVIRPNVPSEDLMPKAEMLEEPKFAT